MKAGDVPKLTATLVYRIFISVGTIVKLTGEGCHRAHTNDQPLGRRFDFGLHYVQSMALVGRRRNCSIVWRPLTPMLHSYVLLHIYMKKMPKGVITQISTIQRKKHTWVIFRYMYWVRYTVKKRKTEAPITAKVNRYAFWKITSHFPTAYMLTQMD